MRYCLIALFLLSLAHGAYIYGDIYSAEGMEKLEGAVIKIKGDGFSYYMVAEKANYSLQLPDGRYDITAEYYGEDGELLYSTSDNLYLSSNDAQLDLVLSSPAQDNLLILLLFGIILLGIILFAVSRYVLKAPLKEEHRPEQPKKKELDEDSKKILKALDSFEGRATQKELKETLNYSDSKMSLVLAELEHEGRIKRFKRGRGNIIKKV